MQSLGGQHKVDFAIQVDDGDPNTSGFYIGANAINFQTGADLQIPEFDWGLNGWGQTHLIEIEAGSDPPSTFGVGWFGLGTMIDDENTISVSGIRLQSYSENDNTSDLLDLEFADTHTWSYYDFRAIKSCVLSIDYSYTFDIDGEVLDNITTTIEVVRKSDNTVVYEFTDNHFLADVESFLESRNHQTSLLVSGGEEYRVKLFARTQVFGGFENKIAEYKLDDLTLKLKERLFMEVTLPDHR